MAKARNSFLVGEASELKPSDATTLDGAILDLVQRSRVKTAACWRCANETMGRVVIVPSTREEAVEMLGAAIPAVVIVLCDACVTALGPNAEEAYAQLAREKIRPMIAKMHAQSPELRKAPVVHLKINQVDIIDPTDPQ